MQLPLTEQQRRHLRSVRETQLAEWRARSFIVDDIFVEREVVRLMASMDHFRQSRKGENAK
jgi:hypothetical protein